LIVCVFEDVPPALVAVQLTAVVPSALIVVVVASVAHAADRDVTGESGSETVKLTVMLPDLYQPFEPFGLAGVTTAVMTGGVESASLKCAKKVPIVPLLPAMHPKVTGVVDACVDDQ
jgi:hypothetical protein